MHFMLVLLTNLFTSDVDGAVGSFSWAVELPDGWNVEPDKLIEQNLYSNWMKEKVDE